MEANGKGRKGKDRKKGKEASRNRWKRKPVEISGDKRKGHKSSGEERKGKERKRPMRRR